MNCFDRALAFLANATGKVQPLVTHTFQLQEYDRALSVLFEDREALKIIIKP